MKTDQILTIMGILWLVILIIKLQHQVWKQRKEDRKHGIFKHWWEY